MLPELSTDNTAKFLAVFVTTLFLGLLGTYYYSLDVNIDFSMQGTNSTEKIIDCNKYPQTYKVYNKFIDNGHYYILTNRKSLYEVSQEEYECAYRL